MRRKNTVIVSLLAVSAFACGDGQLSPSEACHELVDATCSRSLACLSADELAIRDIPGTHAECVAALAARAACSSRTVINSCDADELYQPEEARACIDQVAVMSCSQLEGDRDVVIGDGDDNPDAPADPCERVCLAEGSDQLGQACDVSEQGVCGAGNKCGFVLENPDTGYGTTQCVPDGDRGQGASCYVSESYGSYDDCEAGLVCRQDQCLPICNARESCSGGEKCIADTEQDPFGYCVSTCDPFTQNCPGSQGCYPWDTGSTVCLAEGYSSYSCEFPEDCQSGDTCVYVDGSPRCETICNAGLYAGQQAPQCDALEICYALSGRTDGVGTCVFDAG